MNRILALAAVALLYLLPTIVAFARAHPRFRTILAVNLCLGWTVLGWVATLVWSLLAVPQPDAGLKRFQTTKAFDAAMAVPLILWFGNGLVHLRPALLANAGAAQAGHADVRTWLQLVVQVTLIGFYCMLIYLLAVRERPTRRAGGLLPYVCGFLGTFLGAGIVRLPVAAVSLPWGVASDVLVIVGTIASAVAVGKLGRSFSIMPDARQLVTGGVYAHVRHPLYAAEMIATVGIAIQFAQPLAGLLALGTAVVQVARTVFEERLLTETYPEYAAYVARTWRFIPGVV